MAGIAVPQYQATEYINSNPTQDAAPMIGAVGVPVRNRGAQPSVGNAVPRGSSIPAPSLPSSSWVPNPQPQPQPQPAAPQPQPQPAAQPTQQAPTIGGIVPAGAGGASDVPAGGGSPAMAGLSQFAFGEGIREGFNREGWGDQGAPDMTVPGQRNLPASSRALASLVSGSGKAY